MGVQVDYSQTVDPRYGWDLFRRKELEMICKKENVKFTAGAPATLLRILLTEHGVPSARYRPQHLGPLRGDNGNAYHYEKDAEAVEVKTEIEAVYVENMSRPELMIFLRERGVKYGQNEKKAALLGKARDLINGNQDPS